MLIYLLLKKFKSKIYNRKTLIVLWNETKVVFVFWLNRKSQIIC